MYTMSVPFKDYKGVARTQSVSFNLDAREVFKMLPELKSVFDWMESNREADVRELTTEEVSRFYTDFEQILLSAWGEMSEDGLYFRKTGKFEFEESALFNACMVLFVTKPEMTAKMLEGVMPPELFEMVKNVEDSDIEKAIAARANESEKDLEIARLKSQLAAPPTQ